ncbi:ABC transporter permease [Labrys wisconsinensis]|uniref:Ribose transport system permease protein n=1 Tax=Labrys wisconsinensis TaxID=425677 RepID=A0ABU0JM75_9HYPH|nr:ABC transporter permease [Labrys wisconsinensis]MDQ0475386.1 ribose transport system permease protein [Labrys wisconsinensis]
MDQHSLGASFANRARPASRFGANISFLDLVQGIGLLAVILLGCLVMTVASPVFATTRNLENVLQSATIIAVVAIGQTFVILVAGIDLSVASVLVLSSVLSVGLVEFNGWSPGLAILAALGTGALFGLANGLAVTKLRIPALIATLATMSIGRGLAYIFSGGQNIAPVPDIFVDLQDARILGVPAVIVLTLALAAIAQFVLSRTRFGRSVYATGGNALAARLAGIRTDRVIIATYVISGLMAGIAGLLITARFEAGAATAAQGMELAVIAAVVIGGVSLFGGEGNMGGMLLGVLLLGLVQNAVNLLDVPPNYDSVVSGLVIAAAAALDVYRRSYLEAGLRRRVIAAKEAKAEKPK